MHHIIHSQSYTLLLFAVPGIALKHCHQSAIIYVKTAHQNLTQKAGDILAENELITITIDTYMNLQRIKKANGSQENIELNYQLKGVVAKLSSMGINVEDLTL